MGARHPEHHPRAIAAADIIRTARSLAGVPYEHQGRTERAFDCIGFVLFVARREGIAVEEYSANYGRLPRHELLERVERHCHPIAAPEPGALIVIRWPGDLVPSHCAICCGATLIHCYANAGKVVERGYREPWRQWTHSLWRFPNVVA